MKQAHVRFVASSPAVFDQILGYRRLGGYEINFMERQLVVTDYFDTERWDLLKAKMIVRVKRIGRTCVLGYQRLSKRPGNSDVLHRVEQTLSDVYPKRLAELKCDIMDEVREVIHQHPLLVVLTVENNRGILDMTRLGESRFQMVMDDVEFVGARDQRRHFEVEITCTGADKYELEALLGVLRAGFSLEESAETKFERGLRLMRAWPVGVAW